LPTADLAQLSGGYSYPILQQVAQAGNWYEPSVGGSGNVVWTTNTSASPATYMAASSLLGDVNVA